MSDNPKHPAGGNRAQRRARKEYKRYRELKLAIPRHEKMLARRTGELSDSINQILNAAVDETFEVYSDEQDIDLRKIEAEFSRLENRDLIKAVMTTDMFTAKTPEGTVYEMVKVVEARIQGRQFLRMILAAIDNTALHIIKTTPAWAKDLRGGDLAHTIYTKLTEESFVKRMAGREEALSGALTLAAKTKWRGADDKTIHAVFLKAAADRAADIKEGGVDDMFDEELILLPPEERVERTAKFKKRLDMEYERLVLDEQIGMTFDDLPEFSAGQKRCMQDILVAARTIPQPFRSRPLVIACENDDGSISTRVTDEADAHSSGRPDIVQAIDVALRRVATLQMPVIALAIDAAGMCAATCIECAPELGTVLRDALSKVPAKAKATIPLKPRAPYDDKSFMRVGATFWEDTYKRGMSDADTAGFIAAGNIDTGFADDAVQFAALWAVHAFQRITTSHTFAAALMCSDADRGALESIQKQWRAFMVVVPDGMLVIKGKDPQKDPHFDFGRILLASYEGRSRMILLATNIRTQDGSTVFVSTYDEAASFTDLLMLEPDAELEKDDQSRRLMVMAKRLVAGLLLSLQHEPNFKAREVEAKPPSKKHREGEPAHRIVNVGRPLTVDCRDAVRRYIEEGKGKRKGGHGAYSPPTVQVLVRGHWRQQPHGPRSSLRKRIWLEPFWRGPEGAIIQTRPLKPE
jgi:hypothetical protein